MKLPEPIKPLAPAFAVLRAPPLSLRVKLMLWTVTVFLVIQASLALILQLYQANAINSFFNDRLMMRAKRYADSIGTDPRAISSAALEQLVSDRQKFVLPEAMDVLLYDAQGALVASYNDPGIEVADDIAARALAAQSTVFSTATAQVRGTGPQQRRAARMVLMPLASASGERFVLALVVSDDFAYSMLDLLRQLVLFSIAIGVAASGVAAYIISGIAVRPISALTTAVRRLSPESIGDRVDVPASSREMSELQDELELARKRIEAGFRAQERFMSNVSHEIKTPIAVMLAEAQTIRVGAERPDLRDFVRSVSEEAVRLGKMVDSFLLLTRVRHGKAEVPRSETCLVRDVLMDSFESCRPMALQFEVRLDVRLPEGPHADSSVAGNCDLLRTVFDNLVRNAIRFSPRGSVVRMSATVEDGRVRATVRDQGRGIPVELLPRIFDRFSQAADEEKRGRGHGLGLEIALGIVELHGGTITVRNRSGDGPPGTAVGDPDEETCSGAEFIVILPLLKSNTPECHCDENHAPAQCQPGPAAA